MISTIVMLNGVKHLVHSALWLEILRYAQDDRKVFSFNRLFVERVYQLLAAVNKAPRKGSGYD